MCLIVDNSFAVPAKTCVHLPVMKCFYTGQVMCTNVYMAFCFILNSCFNPAYDLSLLLPVL